MITLANIYLLFIVVGIVGLGYSLFGGDIETPDIGDTGHADGDKIFSTKVIFTFLLSFAMAAGIIYINGHSIFLQILGGTLSGILFGYLVYSFFKFIYKFQGSSNLDTNSLVGKVGTVMLNTTDGGKSQAQFESGFGEQVFMIQEINGQKLKRGDNIRGERVVGGILMVSKI